MLTPVGVTTQNYINALKADSPVHIKMTFASQGITLTDQDVDSANALTLNDIMNGDIDLTFGRAVMKQMTIGILNTSRVSGLIWTDEFTLELGVEINGATNYVKIGTFVGEKPNNITNVQVINFTAYDYMDKFNKLVDDYWTNVNFPASVETIYHGLCNYVGVGYISADELPNIMSRTFTTAPAQLQGYTCRDLLAWIAEACGCYAKINADGNCKMVWYTDHSSDLAFALDDEFHIETADLNTGLTWDEFDEYYWNDADKLEWNDVCSYEEAYMIDSIQVTQLGADIDVCYPYETDGNVYMIVENPFLSVESPSDITNYIQPLYDRLIAHGGHLPMKVQCIGNYLVETGDIISVNVDGVNTLIAPVYSRTLRWYGACRDEYETTGNVERVKVSSENRQKLVNRNNIRLVASDLYYNIQSGVDITPDGVEISGNKYIKIKSGSAIDIESGGKFRITSDNFTIDENGNVTINGSGTFSGTLNAATGTFSGSLNAATGTFNGTLNVLNWEFNTTGIIYDNGSDPLPFQIARYDDAEALSSGIFTDYETGSGMCIIRAGCVQNVHPSTSGYWLGEFRNEVVDEANMQMTFNGIRWVPNFTYTFYGNRSRFYPYGMDGDIGRPENPIIRMYGNIYYGKRMKEATNYEDDELILSPRTDNAGYLRLSLQRSSLGTANQYDRILAEFTGQDGNSNFETWLFGVNYICGSATYTNIPHADDWHTIYIYPHKSQHIGFSFSYYFYDYSSTYKIDFSPNLSSTYSGYTYKIESNGKNLWEMKNMKSFSGETGTFTTVNYTNLLQNSSKDIKHNIKPIESKGNEIDKLKPVFFVYDNDSDEKQHMGLVYEDTLNVMPEICTDNESQKAINYIELIPALLKEIQDLRSRVKALERGDN